MFQTASRISGLGKSPIRALSEGAPPDAIPLGLGEPGWALPDIARHAMGAGTGMCSYGPNAGLPVLREAVARYTGSSADRIFLGCGSQGVLYSLFQAFLEQGDAVLVPNPGFVAYPVLAKMASAQSVVYPLALDFTLDAALFKQALDDTPNAKMAIINHPANPTGAGASPETLRQVAAHCEARGVLLVSDEVYRELYLVARPVSLRDVTDSGLVLGSVSKAWGAPGLRVGWAEGDAEVLEAARRVHSFMVTAPARPCQEAAAALIEASGTVIPAARQEVAKRFEILKDAMREFFATDIQPPAGGFYHWMRLPGSAAEPMPFCVKLRDEAKVVVVPGMAFGEAGKSHLRLSFGGDPSQLREGIRRLAPWW